MPPVLVISYAGNLGGAERILIDFAGGLDGEICLLCPEGPLAAAAREAGIRVFPRRSRPLRLRGGARRPPAAARHLLAHGREARALIRDLDPELVLAWGMRPALACLLGPRPPSPVVFQHNDLLPGAGLGRLIRAAAGRAELVLALSHAIADDLDPGSRLGERLAVVHPGVDVARFAGGTAPAQPPELLVLGALVQWKEPELALEICALARRRLPELRLRLVGGAFPEDGDELPRRLRERAAAPDLAGAVELTGPLSDPRPALARATALLHCARREPFGLAVVEALASGRPAVVPASAGPAEIVDPSCGALYPPGDAPAAAQAVVALLEDPARAAGLGAGARGRARERFALADCRRRYAEALDPLRRRGAARPSAGAVAAGQLTLVTVTHNSGPQLTALLASVARHLPGVRVICVDAGSRDDSIAVAAGHDFALPVELGSNLGFGRACNRGVAEVRSPVTLLLNPDTELLDDSVLALAAEVLREPGARLLAPLVLSGDGSRQDTVHPLPLSGTDLASSLIPPRMLPGAAGRALAPWRARQPRRVGWAVGCALLARTDTLRALGPFDERIFLYGEDLDLGLRAREAGVETWFWPQARVLHHRAHSTRVAFGGEPFERLAGARHQIVSERLGRGRVNLDDGAQALTFASRALLKLALGRPALRERRQLAAVIRARRAAPR